MTPPRHRASDPDRYVPKAVQRSPGLDEDERSRTTSRTPPSSLRRMEGEEKELARRSETVRVGLRLTVMGAVVLGLFSVMIFRLWSLQVLHSSSAINSVLNLTTRDVPISPPRGLIEARGGQVIVSDKVEPVVTLNRQIAASDPAVVERLAVALGMPLAQIQATIADQQDSIYQPVPVEVGVSPSTIVYLSEHRAMFPGVTVSNVAERQYPYGDLAAQTLGYVGDISASELKQLQSQGYTQGDVLGQSGIEAQYERYLRGRTGIRQLEVDAAGDPVGTKHITPALPGDEVVLNMDLGLQRAAEADLQNQISYLDQQGNAVHSGAVVVENPQTGAILAMASSPTYNPAWWVGGMSTSHYQQLTSASSNDPLINRAIQGLYTPGSTFKLATATAALNDAEYLPPYGPLTPYTMISDPGSFTIPNCTSGCTFQDDASLGCGSCNVVTAIAMSDDVFFYTLGYWFYQQPGRYGRDPIQKVAAEYGLGQPSGIDLPGALPGQVDSPQLRVLQHKQDPAAFPNTYYGPGDALQTAFGQGETVITPLALANAYSTFANGGTRYAPELASEIISPTGKVVKRIRPRVMARVPLPAATRQAMMSGFEQEVTSPIGTGYPPAQLTNYPYSKLPIAGKTGTSQVNATNSNYTDALYVAFGPVSSPKYCIAVVIPGGGYGDLAAAPVAFRLFEYLIKHPLGKVTPKTPSGAG
ncbi:MAG: penicillin-binding protein 2 [Acidimicrobiales bacterium]